MLEWKQVCRISLTLTAWRMLVFGGVAVVLCTRCNLLPSGSCEGGRTPPLMMAVLFQPVPHAALSLFCQGREGNGRACRR